MSFIITVHTNEGIIMASDSRTTHNNTFLRPEGILECQVGVQVTDTVYKTFLCQGRIGISTCGAASINGLPIAGYIENCISTKTDNTSTVESVSQGLLDYFSQFTPVPATIFIVAGYDKETLTPQVNRVFVSEQEHTIQAIPVQQSSGVIWNGESDILSRLIGSVFQKSDDGTYTELTHYDISYNFFTLQDAINFAEYAVDVTIRTMSFQNRVKTVGGPIDILAIKPDGAFWIKRKELHA